VLWALIATHNIVCVWRGGVGRGSGEGVSLPLSVYPIFRFIQFLLYILVVIITSNVTKLIDLYSWSRWHFLVCLFSLKGYYPAVSIVIDLRWYIQDYVGYTFMFDVRCIWMGHYGSNSDRELEVLNMFIPDRVCAAIVTLRENELWCIVCALVMLISLLGSRLGRDEPSVTHWAHKCLPIWFSI